MKGKRDFLLHYISYKRVFSGEFSTKFLTWGKTEFRDTLWLAQMKFWKTCEITHIRDLSDTFRVTTPAVNEAFIRKSWIRNEYLPRCLILEHLISVNHVILRYVLILHSNVSDMPALNKAKSNKYPLTKYLRFETLICQTRPLCQTRPFGTLLFNFIRPNF